MWGSMLGFHPVMPSWSIDFSLFHELRSGRLGTLPNSVSRPAAKLRAQLLRTTQESLSLTVFYALLFGGIFRVRISLHTTWKCLVLIITAMLKSNACAKKVASQDHDVTGASRVICQGC
jgi:hypothetical protein